MTLSAAGQTWARIGHSEPHTSARNRMRLHTMGQTLNLILTVQGHFRW